MHPGIGFHTDPFPDLHWHCFEVIGWIITRDFAAVAGIRKMLSRTGQDAEHNAGAVLTSLSIDGNFPVSGEKLGEAFTELQNALAKGEVNGIGRHNSGELAPIPSQAWESGKFSTDFGGAWWEGEPQHSVYWSDIRIPHFDVCNRFQLQTDTPPIRPPEPTMPWVPLTAALLWIDRNYAADIDELNGPPLSMLGLSGENIRCLLELAWLKLANAASQEQVTVRGRRFDGSQTKGDEIELTLDDLLNCKWFDWAAGDRDAPIMAAVHRFKPDDTVAMIHSAMVNFSYVRVEREGLLQLWPVPAAINSMGAALTQQMSPFTSTDFGTMVPLVEARNRIAATFPPLDTNGTPSAEAMTTAAEASDAITDQLRQLLKSGAVPAFVVKSDGSLWCIPSGYWGSFHDFRPLAGAGFFTEASHGALAHGLNDAGVFVGSGALVKAMSPAAVTVAATRRSRSAMETWLNGVLAKLPVRSHSKGDFAAEAARRFGTNTFTFNAAWSRATFEKPEWSRAGARPKNRVPLSTID